MLGEGLGAIITPPLTVWTMQALGWQWAFITRGSMGLVWVVLWQRWYHAPDAHPSIELAEQTLIRENRCGHQIQAGGSALLSHRVFWGVLIARGVSDSPLFLFLLLFWLPQYLIGVRGFDLVATALFAWLPWVAADLGALVGGYLSSSLVTRGKSLDRARLLHRLQRPGACPHFFWLVCHSDQGCCALYLTHGSVPCGSGGNGVGVFGAV